MVASNRYQKDLRGSKVEFTFQILGYFFESPTVFKI